MHGLSISLALLSLAGLPQEKVVYVPAGTDARTAKTKR